MPRNSLKPFWNDYLDSLKEKSVFWGRLWVDDGRPRSGEIFRIKTACSLNYKNAIRQAIYDYEHSFDDELYEHFLQKEPVEFWKCWNKKFKRGVLNDKVCINGLHDNTEIAQEFANSFSEACRVIDDNDSVINEFYELCSNRHDVIGDSKYVQDITVECTDKCLVFT